MFEDIAHYEGRLAKICGPARSGKTEALVRRCVALMENGIEPGSILVEVSSGLAAQAFRSRLREAMGRKKSADKVRIVTARELCVEVLSREDALAATNRRPRLLSPAEYNFFLEDMKTLGQPVRRLRKMLEFFYARWSLLEDERNWLEPGEESKARAHAARLLEGYGAMLPQEVAYVCACFLNSDAGVSARGSYAYVLCDDHQNLSHAEQTCLCLLAERQLIVAGNPNQEISRRGEHPYARGFVEFETLRRNVQVF
ncbi:UvrD-helicase domain-containing protein, partial [Slackia piriformis]|uniref:UvrD-helicase domain-containing protein n=1 Tax=Slackia piriformis TaxID=626934 RepID=UPI0023F267E7